MGALRLQEVSSLLLEAFRDFYRVWTRFLATDLFYKVVAFIILTPLAGLILRLFLATSGSAVIADQDIFFLCPPTGRPDRSRRRQCGGSCNRGAGAGLSDDDRFWRDAGQIDRCFGRGSGSV